MWRRALSAGGGYVGVTALYRALAAPLEVEWSLRDTLVSQRSVTDREWRPDQGNQLLRATADRIEHVDDNAKHFVTRARPHATTVIRALGWLPGVRQTVRSTASPGHLNEVLTLLDPGRQTLRAGAGASADARSRRRTVVVTSCEDTHARQPQNGIRVAPFDSQRMMLILSGGKYAIGGRFAANALDIDDVAWPLEIVAFDGSSVGGGNQMFLDGVDRSETAVRWGAPSARRREFTRRAERSARESERERAASAQAERDDLVLEAKRLLDDASRIRPGRSRPLLRATADLHDDSAEALGLLKRAGVFARDDGFQRDTALAPRDAARIARAKRLCDEAERQWFAASAARMRAEAAELLARAGVFLRAAEAVEAREHEADRAAAAQRAERANGGRLRGKLVVVPRQAGEIGALVLNARDAGAAALLVVDDNAKEPCALPAKELNFPVVSVGRAVKYVFSNPHVHRKAASEATCITTAALAPAEVDDKLMLNVGARLLLCWLVPDVRWVLAPASAGRAVATE